ncbi:MAG: HAD-IIIA family hydrolase [Chitinivibrionales bacterium]|nr:HAD-IIIA family hydrolase [Chitinivibrionales bacterium]
MPNCNTPSLSRAVFLDRDGTIIEDRGHIRSVGDIELYPFAVKALKLLQEKYLLFIVTNQSGIGLGKVRLDDAIKVNDHLVSVLEMAGICIHDVYMCSHTRDDNCECIKPKPYFIQKAQNDYNLDITNSFTIGDHPHDVEFGTRSGATGLYVLTGHGKKHRAGISDHDVFFENLLEAAHWIIESRAGKTGNPK